jgi:CheY-like chemotaxis protein
MLPARPAPSGPPERPRGRFLIVDDEPAVLKVCCQLLGPDQCVTANSGREALALLRMGERFDAILCDVMMPGTSGMDVFEELTRIAPKQARRMLFVTGGAFTEGARQFLESRSDLIIEKPFRGPVLLGRVNRLLEETKAFPPCR